MKIRQETPADYIEVYELVKQAFATTTFSDGTEPDYLNDLRKENGFIPELSLIAENEEGRITGQIVLYKMIIKTTERAIEQLVLSPISVHPDYFRQGIARKMMEAAFTKAIDLGYTAVFLCGDPDFYRKLGFEATYTHRIYHEDDKGKNADWCMVKELQKGALTGVHGTVDIQ